MKTLTPVNGRKSFYGKCKMLESPDGHTIYLKSYDTIVAEYNTNTKEMTVHGWYSNTTATHINAFLHHFGFPGATKKEMESWSEYLQSHN